MSILEAQFQLLFRTLVQGLLLALVMTAPCAAAQDSAEPKRVLIVYANDSSTTNRGTAIDRAIGSTLKDGSPVRIEIYFEYVGDRRLGTQYEKEFVALMQRKYEGKKFDVIFTINLSPLRILLRNRAELFPDTPIVFLTLDQRNVTDLYPAPGVTGVWGEISFKPNLELALALHPGTRRVVVIGGVSDFDRYWTARAQEDFRAYESSLEFIYLSGLSVPEMRKALAGLPPHTIGFFVTSVRDNAGNIYESPEFLEQVSPVSTAPIYGTTEAQLGQGIVGGRILTFEALGIGAGQMGLRVLAGEKPEAIAPHGIPSAAMFDWRELQRWRISESHLPPGSIVRFRVPSFWQEYKWYAIAVISVVIVQSLLIIGLVINRTRRKHAEAALREAKESLTIAVEASQMGTWDLDLTQDFSGHRSLRHDQIFGYDSTQPEWGREIARRHIVEEDLEVFDAAFARAMETGELEFEARIRWPNGSLHWMAARGRFYFDESGQPTRGAGVNFDITELKSAEAALRESEDRFRGIYEHAPMGIAITDWQWYFQQCNSAYCAMLGYTEEELRHKVFSELVHPDDRDANVAEIRLLMAGELPFFEIDNRYVRKDGEVVWVHKFVSVLRDEKGAPAYFLALVNDITERKLAEEALRESEERFRHMADTAPVMIWISGADKLYTYFNQQWLNFTGRSMGEELGNGWARGVHADDYERCRETYTDAFRMRQPFTMEYRIRRADGEFRWVLESGNPRFSPGEIFLGYIGSCIDITERKHAEEALGDLSGQLIRAREDECARIARELHDDLNQRMALISIELELLGQNPLATNGSLRGQLQGILNRAADVSREIRRISHDLHPSKLTQLGLVAAVTSLCDDAMSSHQLKIEFVHEGVPADLPRDVSLCLYRIVQECLNNVIKHSGAAEAKVEFHGTANEFRLRVSDSGNGFDVESTRIRNGLGLVSMRERLRLVGGQISIVSRAPSGTQVDATVPLRQLSVDYEDHSTDESRLATPV